MPWIQKRSSGGRLDVLGISKSSSKGSRGRACSSTSSTRGLILGDLLGQARDKNASLRGTHGVGDTVGSGAVRSLMIPVGLESSSAEVFDSAFIFMSSAVMAGEAEGVRLGEAGSGRLCHDESRDPYRSLMSRA